jgi:hypothetical protein
MYKQITLIGRKFVVITDHKALTTFMRSNNLTGMKWRWASELQEYQPFLINWRPGSENALPDMLLQILNEDEKDFILVTGPMSHNQHLEWNTMQLARGLTKKCGKCREKNVQSAKRKSCDATWRSIP